MPQDRASARGGPSRVPLEVGVAMFKAARFDFTLQRPTAVEQLNFFSSAAPPPGRKARSPFSPS